MPSQETQGQFPEDFWERAFPRLPPEWKAPGASHMLYLVAYDITEPKRLSKIAKICEDYGIRVQFSVFECRLTPELFDQLWERLTKTMDKKSDRLVAYRLDARNAKETLTAGTMVCSQKVVCYIY